MRHISQNDQIIIAFNLLLHLLFKKPSIKVLFYSLMSFFVVEFLLNCYLISEILLNVLSELLYTVNNINNLDFKWNEVLKLLEIIKLFRACLVNINFKLGTKCMFYIK